MRFVLYNIRYGTGGGRFLFPWSGYLRFTESNLGAITNFITSIDPDIVGLVEVDAGSYRSGRKNQAQEMAEALGHYNVYRSKYAVSSVAQRMPIINKQGNAFLTRDSIRNVQFHYFDRGMKRLVIELELEHLTVFLVHLALNFRVRHEQLGNLYTLVKGTRKPHIVAGDFNAWWGDREIKLFLAATEMARVGPANLPTYPSWAPRRPLDFILHSRQIRITHFEAPRVTFSDHLPLVCDFEIDA